MLPSKLKLVYCHNSSEISSNLLLKVEVYYFKVTSILERVCDVGHASLEETMKSAIYWKGMEETIRSKKKSCKTCQVNNVHKKWEPYHLKL